MERVNDYLHCNTNLWLYSLRIYHICYYLVFFSFKLSWAWENAVTNFVSVLVQVLGPCNITKGGGLAAVPQSAFLLCFFTPHKHVLHMGTNIPTRSSTWAQIKTKWPSYLSYKPYFETHAVPDHCENKTRKWCHNYEAARWPTWSPSHQVSRLHVAG